MSYSIELVDENGETIEIEDRKLSMSITYDFADYFYQVFGEKGIRSLYGLRVREAKPLIINAMIELSNMPWSDDSQKITPENAVENLELLMVLCYMAPSDAILRGKSMTTNLLTPLLGQTILHIINKDNREITFELYNNTKVVFFHSQECSEDVRLIDITGNLQDLLGLPLRMAEEVIEETDRDGTWTFYKFATILGYVTFRWFGENSGFYSETVEWKII